MKYILFDLDGTLLPMDEEVFTRAYFKALIRKLAPYGYDPDTLVNGIWAGFASMVRNDGGRTNEEAFWETFAHAFGDSVYQDKLLLDGFYANEFDQTKEVCGYNPEASALIRQLKADGYQIVIASNPIFPEVAQKKRLTWAGLDNRDFIYITTYEDSHYCKPNPEYYREIIKRMECKEEDCLMVGNDVEEDMIAYEVGIQTFLLTDCLINTKRKDISIYSRGGFKQLREFIYNDSVL